MFVRRWLARAPGWVFSAWATLGAFTAYFCMYAFRKPFTAASYAGTVSLPLLPPIDLKAAFVIAQVLGYATSKFLGIKVVSELRPARRAVAILVLIAIAELALVFFALVPVPYNALCLFLNGLPLGMIWGLVFGFLEGRKTSDLLGAGLCASFILASGFVKAVGKTELDAWGVSAAWMPALTGLLFVAPLALAVWMLAVLPPPSAADEAARAKRAPMDGAARAAFFRAHAPGLVMLVAGYVLLTACRDFRDNFARELWDGLGFDKEPSILATSEIPVALGSVACIPWLMAVRSNRRALGAIHAIMIGGVLVAGAATLLFHAGVLGPVPWMIGVGLGTYLAYVPFNCVLFDRLIAALGSIATAGFLIYVADSFGYLGSIGLLLFKNFGTRGLPLLEFYSGFVYLTVAACVLLFGAAGFYFWRRTHRDPDRASGGTSHLRVERDEVLG